MESLSFKDIKVGRFYKISVKDVILNFGSIYHQSYYVKVDSIAEKDWQYIVKGSFFLQDTFGVNKSYYGAEVFTKDVHIEQVSYDAVREQETKEELKREIAENTVNMFEAMDRRFEQHRRSHLVITIGLLMLAALSVVRLIIGS